MYHRVNGGAVYVSVYVSVYNVIQSSSIEKREERGDRQDDDTWVCSTGNRHIGTYSIL